MMYWPKLIWVCVILGILLASCKDQPQKADNTSNKEPIPLEELSDETIPDTSLAAQYVAKAEKFAEQKQFDSLLVYYKKAIGLYERDQNWIKYITCNNSLARFAGRSNRTDLAIGISKSGPDNGTEQVGRKTSGNCQQLLFYGKCLSR